MSRIMHPPRCEHHRLRQPMTAGEQKLLDLFDDALDLDWEIYVQPHLNGLRPDFVLLNPKVGICVVEVKDWNLNAMRYFVKKHANESQELYADDGRREFAVDNPFRKIRRYKDAIFNIYCPRLQHRFGYAAIVGSVIFPFAERARVLSLQKPFLKKDEGEEKSAEYWPIGGRDELTRHGLSTILPILRRDRHSLMSAALADDLRGWMVEPDFASTQRRPLEMDKNQRTLASSRTESGYRRIKGPAGSGKSLVIAARAAKLSDEGKTVLIVTFNMTLWHYLRDLVARAVTSKGWLDRITFVHFHEWCKDVCIEAKLDEKYAEMMQPIANIMSLNLDPKEEARRLRPILAPILNIDLPVMAQRAVSSNQVARFDAVFVDEGQDYLPLWWNALRGICKPDGEMLLVADATQDVYGTAKNWTEEAMSGAGFFGRWSQLSVGYRLPPDALQMAQEFAQRFLPDDTRDVPELDQETLDLFPCDLRWIQCPDQEAMRQCVNAVLAMMRKTGAAAGTANADITFLANDIDFGRTVVDELATYRVSAAHTFERDKLKQDRMKMAFYLGDARIKATTFHSFKGWETRLIVVHVRRAIGPEGMAAIYAALTRLKRSEAGSHLTVVCSAPELADFGALWPMHEDLFAASSSKGGVLGGTVR